MFLHLNLRQIFLKEKRKGPSTSGGLIHPTKLMGYGTTVVGRVSQQPMRLIHLLSGQTGQKDMPSSTLSLFFFQSIITCKNISLVIFK